MTTTKVKQSDLNNADFGVEIQNDLEYLINLGISSGADLVEIFLEKTNNISLLAEQDRITSVNPSFSKGAGIRVFLNDRDGFVSTNNITKQGINKALEDALAMLGLDIKALNSSFFNGLNQYQDFGRNKGEWLEKCPNLEDASNKLLKATDKLTNREKFIDIRRGSYSRSWQEVIVACSDGTFARDIRLHQSTGLNILASDGNYRASIGRRYGSYGNPNDLVNWDSEESANEICQSAGRMLYADYVEAGQMPVVLANKFGGVIFHEACGHLLETTQIERGTSPFSDKLNKKIANEAVTAIDEGITKGAFGTISMDDEGMVPEKTVLIEKGILKKFMSDRAGELRTGHKRTGSGRRQSHSFAPASRMRNTYIAPGNYKPNELIQTIDHGLYCKSMGGGSVGPTGQFNFSVEEGYIIKQGKLTKPVKGATLIGEAKDVLPRISMCANDLELAAGFCGSISGSVNVTVGQPHIKVDSITIGGR